MADPVQGSAADPGLRRHRWWQRKHHHCVSPRKPGAEGDTWVCPYCGQVWTFGAFTIDVGIGPSDRTDDGIRKCVGWYR